MVSKKEFAQALRKLLDSGFRFTVIGGSVVELELGSRDLGDDIDLFAEAPSPVIEEEEYYRVAEENGWVIGQTWLGTPRVIVRVDQAEVPVEFYDNIYDFYVPEEILRDARKIRVSGVTVRAVRVEDHIVLKANAGRRSDMERLQEIARLVKKGKLQVDVKRIQWAAELFDDRKGILNRLRSAGFKV
ncbi:MAG: nucleotidyltransferase [Desulfurococcales archaeon]|nr:nucleotidyltransferase [Desulfurococcales archaeon]